MYINVSHHHSGVYTYCVRSFGLYSACKDVSIELKFQKNCATLYFEVSTILLKKDSLFVLCEDGAIVLTNWFFLSLFHVKHFFEIYIL